MKLFLLRSRISLIIALFTLNVSAFNISTYTSKQCSGLAASIQLNVADGCNRFRAGESQAIIMPWLSDLDNEVMLATYSTEYCCHADLIETYGWADECTPFTQQGVQSWRVIDPNDPDKGVQEEMSDYSCDNCGKDGCGEVTVW